MLNKLKSLLRSDDLLASLSVFPEIDQDKIARELKIESEGKMRGTRNQPTSDANSPDHIETSIITRIEGLRRRGLENYENNRQVYNERLSRAGALRKEVDIVAGNARGDFLASLHRWKSTMTSSTERLRDTFRYRTQFRERHNLQRPARQFEGWWKFSMLTVILIILEAGLNSIMFSRGSEQGLLGGLMTATIISALNVMMSTGLGVFACNLNHSNILRKFSGAVFASVWFAFALALNLMLAHFRDLIDAGTAWDTALQQAVPSLMNSPIALTSMDSWILAGIGFVISTSAFLKGWHARDPFPGYAAVELDLDHARMQHEEDLANAIDELTAKRDEAIEELRDADQQVRDGIGQAIDALYGHSALTAHLQTFLDQCDTKLSHLLAVYRDANRAARSDREPRSFSQPHSFGAFTTAVSSDDERKHNAEAEADLVSSTVDATIKEIFTSFENAVREFQLPEDVQRGEVKLLRVA